MGVRGISNQTVSAGAWLAQVPNDPSQQITFKGSPVTVTALIPGTSQTLQTDSLTVYDGASTATVAQPLAEGVQLMAVAKDPSASTSI